MKNTFGLIGEKLSHSISPQIHHSIFKKTQFNGKYYLFEIEKENLIKSIEGFKLLGIGGLNVTIPYKTDVIKSLTNISKEANEIGAVNTIKFKDNELTGYNTDYNGFGYMVKKSSTSIKNENAVILGAGGASRAVIKYLSNNNISKINIVTRNKEKIKEDSFFNEYNILNYDEILKSNLDGIIINCTPCGMYPNTNESPVNKNVLSKFHTALDLIYNPRETEFLKISRQLGGKTENGLSMLIGQAFFAQEIFREEKLPESIIDDICLEIN